MNPGYIAFLSYWLTFILFWIGILSSFLKQIHVKKNVFLIIFLASWIGSFYYIPIKSDIQINLGSVIIPLLLSMWIWNHENDQYRVHLFSAAALIGVAVLLTRGVTRMDPVLMILDEKYMLTILTIVLTLVAVRQYAHQFYVITLGLLLEEGLYTWYFWDKIKFVHLGNGFYRDIWWMSLLGAAFIHFIFQYSRSLVLSKVIRTHKKHVE